VDFGVLTLPLEDDEMEVVDVKVNRRGGGFTATAGITGPKTVRGISLQFCRVTMCVIVPLRNLLEAVILNLYLTQLKWSDLDSI
jgi:hypothetical protein